MQGQPTFRPALKGVDRKPDTWLGFSEDLSSTRWPKELKNSSKEDSAPGTFGKPPIKGRAVTVIHAAMLRNGAPENVTDDGDGRKQSPVAMVGER